MRRPRPRHPPPTTDQRPPLERLEALIAEPHLERSLRILWRIRGDLDTTPAPGPWISAAHVLRDRHVINGNTLTYFVEIFLECITFGAASADPELCRIQDEMEAVERTHGLEEDEFWRVDEAPQDWRDLDGAWNRRDHAIRVAFLRELGHTELADGLERDPEGFSDRATLGHSELWPATDEAS
jgi:hypothetical protein